MRRLACLLLLGAASAVGCADAGTDADAERPGTDSDGITAGGCECHNDGHLTLECLCGEFPELCLSYDELKSRVPLCGNTERWWRMEQTGCGKVIISSAPDFGGIRLVYDEATHELVGAGIYSDVNFGSCDSAGYEAGDLTGCDEGTVCSLCDASGETCAPLCSIELLQNTWGVQRYDDVVKIDHACGPEDVAEAQEVHIGCGKLRLNGSTYDAETHELLALENALPECGGVWGDPGEPCADETVCSLCYGADNRCQL